MSYTIYHADGTPVTIPDSGIYNEFYNPNAHGTGIGIGTQLIGKSTVKYGGPIAQNFLQQAENFASATAPTDPQGPQGPQGDPASSGIGYGQTWQNMLVDGPRAFNQTYTNTTGKPIMVAISSPGYNYSSMYIYIGGVTTLTSSVSWPGGANGAVASATFIVPNNTTYSAFYSAAGAANGTMQTLWYELR